MSPRLPVLSVYPSAGLFAGSLEEIIPSGRAQYLITPLAAHFPIHWSTRRILSHNVLEITLTFLFWSGVGFVSASEGRKCVDSQK